MELDELKQQINQKINSAQQQHAVADIASILSKQTTSVVQKIKRSLWIELILSFIFTISCIVIASIIDLWAYKTYFTTFSFAGLALVIVAYFLLRKTNKLSSTNTVKSNLQSLILVLREYVKRYLQIGMILLPICFGFAYLLSYNDPTKVSKPFRTDVFAYLMLFLLVVGPAIYYFSKWYLKKQYGNYINQLEELLKEFEEES